MPAKIWQKCGSDTAKCKLTVSPWRRTNEVRLRLIALLCRGSKGNRGGRLSPNYSEAIFPQITK